jgi:tRNA modification GTPase
LWLHNKADLLGERPPLGADALYVSAATGEGLDVLHARLRAVGGGEGEGAFTARARQVDALRRAAEDLAAADAWWRQGTLELAAEALRAGHDALGEITGKVGADALLGHIFASFCIGK